MASNSGNHTGFRSPVVGGSGSHQRRILRDAPLFWKPRRRMGRRGARSGKERQEGRFSHQYWSRPRPIMMWVRVNNPFLGKLGIGCMGVRLGRGRGIARRGGIVPRREHAGIFRRGWGITPGGGDHHSGVKRCGAWLAGVGDLADSAPAPVGAKCRSGTGSRPACGGRLPNPVNSQPALFGAQGRWRVLRCRRDGFRLEAT
jgi:hypothetical protein